MSDGEDEEDEQLKQALALSLQPSASASAAAAPPMAPPCTIDSDAELAHRLAAQWAEEDRLFATPRSMAVA